MSARQPKAHLRVGPIIVSRGDAENELRRRRNDVDRLLLCAKNAALLAATVEIADHDAAMSRWTKRLLKALQRVPAAPTKRPAWISNVLAQYPTVRFDFSHHGDVEVQRLRAVIVEQRAALERSLAQLKAMPSTGRDVGRPTETGHREFVEQFDRALAAVELPPADSVTVALAAIATGVEAPPGVQVASCLKRWRAAVSRARPSA